MRILFTGSSSFTGYWILDALHTAGHEILATFQKPLELYEGLRAERVKRIQERMPTVFSAPMGSPHFLEAIASQPHWDLWCHHGAHVTDYRSDRFDPIEALTLNSAGLHDILLLLHPRGCRHVLLTGSLFAMRQGLGDDVERAVSPYGLSKGLTHDLFSYYVAQQGMALGHFVIANPFGPLEEERLTRYLAQCWLTGKTGVVTHPDYVRDYMPVDLLAELYCWFAQRFIQSAASLTYAPQGYVGKQRDFVHRFATELSSRWKIPCPVNYLPQKEWTQPQTRINKTPYDPKNLQWNEKAFWDTLAAWYQTFYLPSSIVEHALTKENLP